MQQDQDIRALLTGGRKIEAIRVYRDRYGVGLKEAKDAVEAMEAGRVAPSRATVLAPAAPPSPARAPAPAAPPEFMLGDNYVGSPASASAPGDFMLDTGTSPSLAAPPSLTAPSGITTTPAVTAPPAAASAAATRQMADRNLGQGIDLALRVGRRAEAIQLYRERYGVTQREAEAAIQAREAQPGMPAASSTGCFIATAAYGSALAPEVSVLRLYRDAALARSPLGRAFIRVYYRLSPPLAAVLARAATGRAVVRWLLAPLVGYCRRRLERQS
jgi:ribosomal protein L7/L12